jgi:hypothetical protein
MNHFSFAALAVASLSTVASAAEPAAAIYADDQAIIRRIADLPASTGMNLGEAKLAGKELDKWRKQFYERGPQGRDYCIKMAFNADRGTAFFCGGNHGTPHKLADAWEYHLGSNTWTMLAPPEGGDPKHIIGLYGDIREGKEDEALALVKEYVVLEDGCLVTRHTKGPINTSHTWDGLTYDPRIKRALWAAPATGIKPEIMQSLYAKANGLTIEEVKSKLAPGIDQFWMFDFAKSRWVRHTGHGPYPRISFTCTLTYVPDLGKTFYYMSESRETWTYDAVANKWEQLKVQGADKRDGTPAMELMSAYSPKHRKVVCVQGPDTWTFDITTNTWAKLAADAKNDAQDHRGFFGYDPASDTFLLFQSTKPDELRAFSLVTGKWETLEIKGDQPPEVRGRFQGYFDPARNVLVCCKDLAVWVYRYSVPEHRR